MSLKITPDAHAPSAAVELPIARRLPDYEIEEITLRVPRDVDGVLVKQGFRDLVDDARGILDGLVRGTGLEILQLTGAICPAANGVFHPGLWLVLRDSAAAADAPMSEAARGRVAAIAEELRKRLQLS